MWFFIYYCVVISHATSCQRNLNYYYRGGKGHVWNITPIYWPNHRFPKNVLNVMGGRKTQFGIWLVGGFKYFLFSPLFGEDFHFDSYFSNGLVQPPPSWWIICESLCALPRIVLFFRWTSTFFQAVLWPSKVVHLPFLWSRPFLKLPGDPKGNHGTLPNMFFSGEL